MSTVSGSWLDKALFALLYDSKWLCQCWGEGLESEWLNNCGLEWWCYSRFFCKEMLCCWELNERMKEQGIGGGGVSRKLRNVWVLKLGQGEVNVNYEDIYQKIISWHWSEELEFLISSPILGPLVIFSFGIIDVIRLSVVWKYMSSESNPGWVQIC